MEASSQLSHAINPHQWVDKHADYLYYYAVKRITDTQTAEDLVQETFLAALGNLGKFEGKSSERTWLTAILRNKIVDLYRKKSNDPLMRPGDWAPVEDDMMFFEPSDGRWVREHWPVDFAINDTDLAGNAELATVLKKCMKKLPGLWLAVFTMKHVDDSPTNEICKDLTITQSNFWVIIHRSKVRLRSCLQKNWV